MISARLRHRVTIESLSSSVDSNYGGEVMTWSTYASGVPAEIMPVSGREFLSGQQEHAGVTTKITVRYDSGIVPTMRVVHDSDIYAIKAVLPDKSLRRTMLLMCESGVRDG